MSTASDYSGLYPVLKARRGVWTEIARWIQAQVGTVDVAVELGSGYCDFINDFRANRKLAFDLNPEMAAHAGPDVHFACADVTTSWPLAPASVDLIFASNFLEHLTIAAGQELLQRAHRSLRPGGRIALLQPNFRLCATNYFDDPTHVAVYSDDSLAQAVVDAAFQIERIEPALLPFSMKSRLPKWPILVRLFLQSPIRPNAKQMFILGKKA